MRAHPPEKEGSPGGEGEGATTAAGGERGGEGGGRVGAVGERGGASGFAGGAAVPTRGGCRPAPSAPGTRPNHGSDHRPSEPGVGRPALPPLGAVRIGGAPVGVGVTKVPAAFRSAWGSPEKSFSPPVAMGEPGRRRPVEARRGGVLGVRGERREEAGPSERSRPRGRSPPCPGVLGALAGAGAGSGRSWRCR
jgi:hypothetical protein